MPDRLPVFRLTTPQLGVKEAIALATKLFKLDVFSLPIPVLGRRLAVRAGTRVLELDPSSGGIWAADEAVLWNPAIRPTLGSEDEAQNLARRLVDELGVARFAADSPFQLRLQGVAGTILALETNGKREDHRLDIHVSHGVTIDLSSIGIREELPVVGGGGKFGVTVGDGGEVIGLNGVWRPAAESFEAAMIPQEASNAQFAEMTSGLTLESHESFLAYYSAPVFEPQEFLYPVYVHRAVARIGEELVPMRLVNLPATDFGPIPKVPEPQPKRALTKPARAFERQPGRRGLESRDPFEAGTSWIGTSGGLNGSQKNAKGFVDGLAAAGWTVSFNWGDQNAFESDWRANDDDWVDAADFVFYTGHANMNGWVLTDPDGFLNFSEVGSGPQNPGDLWGQQDLEWMIIAACGPLQDDAIAKGGGSVLSRWDGAFDGLHLMMGYGGITFDNEVEGARIVQYARQGMTLRQAWYRTGQEVQPSTNGASAPDGPTVYVGALWVAKPGADPAEDHLWGHGAVSPDPTSPTDIACMWVPC